MVDYKDRMPLKQIVDLPYYKENLFCVFENTRLDFMFRRFREGKDFNSAYFALKLHELLNEVM
jgi:hypothetical protein